VERWKRLLDNWPRALKAEEVLDLLLECLYPSGVVLVKATAGLEPAYESRFAELSLLLAGLKTQFFPNRAHLSQISCLCVRSHRILSEKQFWHVFERSWAVAAPLAACSAGSDMAFQVQVTPNNNRDDGHGESSKCSVCGYESDVCRA
jgi:hypothetical protein